jgi:NADPH-dependent 2,4-dienoyl-CoA reductase/sulfur reductase-like enzyme
MTDVLVIGAGPAGMAAAVAASESGAAVVVLDASDAVGGQYWRSLPESRQSRRESALHHGWRKFNRLRDRLRHDANIEVITSAQVWAIEPAQNAAARVHVLVGEPDGADRQRYELEPNAIVLATGAHDRTLPFPGWDLPGVFTPGAAQAFAKGERVSIGDRVIVAGAGPFLLPVAASLTRTGSRVLGVYEAASVGQIVHGWLPRPWQVIGAARKGVELAGYVSHQVQRRIPYRAGMAVVAAHGTDRVSSVTIAAVDASWRPIQATERIIETDAVCVGHGFTPRLELAIAAGCRLTADRFVLVDDAQLSTVTNVYAAGEITGIGGVELALAQGQIAGHCAAGGAPNDPSIAAAARQRRTFRRFAARIEAAHGIREGWARWLTDDTTICRCEEVPYGRLRATGASTSSTGLRPLKLTTRAGLGICQGRVCGRAVEDLLARHAPGACLTDDAITDRRPIASPVRLGELAAGHGAGPSPFPQLEGQP